MDREFRVVIKADGASIGKEFSSDQILQMVSELQGKIQRLLESGSPTENLAALKRGVTRLQTESAPLAVDVTACVLIGLSCLRFQDHSTSLEQLLENDGLILRIDEQRIEPVVIRHDEGETPA